jgi:glutaredoxin
MGLKIYGANRSTSTRLVAVVATEKGIPFEFILVDMASREHKSAAYMEKQPFGQVPYIVSDLVFPTDGCWRDTLNMPPWMCRTMMALCCSSPVLSHAILRPSMLRRAPRWCLLVFRPSHYMTRRQASNRITITRR